MLIARGIQRGALQLQRDSQLPSATDIVVNRQQHLEGTVLAIAAQHIIIIIIPFKN